MRYVKTRQFDSPQQPIVFRVILNPVEPFILLRSVNLTSPRSKKQSEGTPNVDLVLHSFLLISGLKKTSANLKV